MRFSLSAIVVSIVLGLLYPCLYPLRLMHWVDQITLTLVLPTAFLMADTIALVYCKRMVAVLARPILPSIIGAVAAFILMAFLTSSHLADATHWLSQYYLDQSIVQALAILVNVLVSATFAILVALYLEMLQQNYSISAAIFRTSILALVLMYMLPVLYFPFTGQSLLHLSEEQMYFLRQTIRLAIALGTTPASIGGMAVAFYGTEISVHDLIARLRNRLHQLFPEGKRFEA